MHQGKTLGSSPQLPVQYLQEHQNRKGTNRIKVTFLALQYLHNFSGLKIPDEDFAILTSTDNMFSAHGAEARGNAICAVGMPSVGLQTVGCKEIPKPYRRVLTGKQGCILNFEFDHLRISI